MKIHAKTEAFAKARILKGLTQRELAARCGISYAYISLLERSLKSVGPATAKRISEELEKPVEEIFVFK